jgi:pseudouridine 5'-phosphatase
MQEELWPKVQPLPGAEHLIRTLVDHGIPIALATSSTREKYELKTMHLQDDFFSNFPENRIIVGDDPRIKPGRGKPHGGIFPCVALIN